MLLDLEKRPNNTGGKFTWGVTLEPKDRTQCSKCKEPFKVDDWVRIERIWDVRLNNYTTTGKIFCHKCDQKLEVGGRMALIKEIEKSDKGVTNGSK